MESAKEVIERFPLILLCLMAVLQLLESWTLSHPQSHCQFLHQCLFQLQCSILQLVSFPLLFRWNPQCCRQLLAKFPRHSAKSTLQQSCNRLFTPRPLCLLKLPELRWWFPLYTLQCVRLPLRWWVGQLQTANADYSAVNRACDCGGTSVQETCQVEKTARISTTFSPRCRLQRLEQRLRR